MKNCWGLLFKEGRPGFGFGCLQVTRFGWLFFCPTKFDSKKSTIGSISHRLQCVYIYRDVRIFNVNVSFKATKTYILFNHLTTNTSNKRSHPTPNKNFLQNLHLRNFQQTPGAYPNPPNHQQYYDEGIPESIIWGWVFWDVEKGISDPFGRYVQGFPSQPPHAPSWGIIPFINHGY